MNTVDRCLPPEILLEEYCRLLQSESAVDALPLTISGNSMAPFLQHGRDTVYLSRITDPLRKGDVVLYRRRNGSYILHRICRIREDVYTMIGDAHFVKEPGIRREQILAVMTSARRNGKLLQPGNFCWEFFGKVWVRMIPLRRPLLLIDTALKRSMNP